MPPVLILFAAADFRAGGVLRMHGTAV